MIDLDLGSGELSILEDGRVVATKGDDAVAIQLTTHEMREFASMLRRCANFIDGERRAAAQAGGARG